MTFSEQFERRHLLGPNGLSILRGLAALVLPFLVLHASRNVHIAASVVFTIAAFTDLVDGILARRYALETKIGRFIDPLADKMLTLGMLASFAALHYYSPWWLVPIFFREILITFFRFGWILEGVSVGAEKMGKAKQGCLVAAVGFALLLTHARDFTSMQPAAGALQAMMFIALFVALVLCIVSGITFSLHQRARLQSPFFAKFVSAMGVGLLKGAPGTWGSALTLLLIVLSAWNGWLYAALFFLLAWAGFWSFARLDGGGKDPGFVVLDEACGMFVALAGFSLHPAALLLGFIYFRIFDILKPFPLRQLERLPGFWGVLLDDLGAGAYAWLLLHLTARFFSLPF